MGKLVEKKKASTPNFRNLADTAISGFISQGLRIRQATELETGPADLIERTYFGGGHILFCSAGKFWFSFDDGVDITIATGDALILYPGSRVTIRAIEAENRLHFVIIDQGAVAAEFLNGFSFYDRLVFQTAFPQGTFDTLRNMLTSQNPTSTTVDAAAISLLSDILRTFQIELRKGGNALFYDAVNLIHANLANGGMRTEPLCMALQTSRSHLHKQFLAHCGIGPGEFIRREQLRAARWYLTNSRMSIKEIGVTVGITSSVYFGNFIRRMTGHTPTEIRMGT